LPSNITCSRNTCEDGGGVRLKRPMGPMTPARVKPMWEIQMARRVMRGEVFWNNKPETIQVKQ
jgi:hypothetical protein